MDEHIILNSYGSEPVRNWNLIIQLLQTFIFRTKEQ